jgi:hypothetical protein
VPSVASGDLPVVYSSAAADVYGLTHLNGSPPGANDPTCRPSAAHPYPVVPVIETSYDEVVTPYTSAFLAGPDVTNIDLQQQCAQDGSEHLSIPFDHIALRDVLNALDPAHEVAPTCSPVLPVLGG